MDADPVPYAVGVSDDEIEVLGRRAKAASRVLAGVSTAAKDAALAGGAELLEAAPT